MTYTFDEFGTFDFTSAGRRPSVRQIVAAWKKAGRPSWFAVTYGETYARFDLQGGRWFGSGNGCRGVRRDAVERALNGEAEPTGRASRAEQHERYIDCGPQAWDDEGGVP